MQTARRYPSAAWLVVAASVLLSVVTVTVRTRGVPLELAVSLGAQALTGPLFAAVGATVLARHRGHRMGRFCLALGAISAGDEFLRAFLTTRTLPSEHVSDVLASLVSGALGMAAFAAFTIFLPLLFPTGDVPGPRWRWVLRGAVVLTAVSLLASLFAAGPMTFLVGETEVVAVTRNPLGIRPLGIDLRVIGDVVATVAVAWFLAGIAATVVRFRRDPVARRQILWFAWGLVIAIGMVMLTAVPGLQSHADVLASLAFAWIPVSIGIAITRYRLYEIDRIISRTVGYLLLSGVLVGAYLVSVLTLGSVARSLTTAGDDLVVAASTLLVAALFRPLRRRVQTLVDRRFNRARYDAERTLATLGSRLRDEVDLDALRDELRTAAAATLQPASSSVWLRLPS